MSGVKTWSVEVRHGGRRVLLRHGDTIGRPPVATLALPNPAVSELHAQVALRDGRFYLLQRGGPVAVEGEAPAAAIELVPGLRVRLGSAETVEICATDLPWWLVDSMTGALPLDGDHYRLGRAGGWVLSDVGGYDAALDREVDGWSLCRGGGEPVRLRTGVTYDVTLGRTVRLERRAESAVGTAWTARAVDGPRYLIRDTGERRVQLAEVGRTAVELTPRQSQLVRLVYNQGRRSQRYESLRAALCGDGKEMRDRDRNALDMLKARTNERASALGLPFDLIEVGEGTWALGGGDQLDWG